MEILELTTISNLFKQFQSKINRTLNDNILFILCGDDIESLSDKNSILIEDIEDIKKQNLKLKEENLSLKDQITMKNTRLQKRKVRDSMSR